jgi:hypothetical protein
MPYRLDAEKPILVYEVMLPKKMSYASKLAEVLDCFLQKDKLKKLPQVITELDKQPSEDAKEEFLSRIQEVISGYSIYEVDGRFVGSTGLADERTWVIRFILHDPRSSNGMSGNFYCLAKEIISSLVTKRFAEELNVEQEIWFIQYGNSILQRWVRETGS